MPFEVMTEADLASAEARGKRTDSETRHTHDLLPVVMSVQTFSRWT